MVKTNKYLEIMFFLTVSILFFIFPVLGFSIFVLYALIIGPKNKIELFVLIISVSLGVSILSFLYNPQFQDTGDIVRYYEEFFKLKNYGGFDIFSSKYIFYFFYYVILNFFLEHGDPRFITAISMFLIYFNFTVAFYLIIKNNYKINDFKILFLFLLIFSPFLSVMTSYKNLLAYSFFFLGLTLLTFIQTKVGIIYLIISCFFHPSLTLPIFIYIFTKMIKYRIKIKMIIFFYLIIYLLIQFIQRLPQTNSLVWFIQAKINSYIFTGNMMNLREFIFSIRYIILYFFNFWILVKMKNKNFSDSYLNFIWNYYILILFLIFDKSIFMRYLHLSLPIFFPIYLYLYKKSPINIKYRKLIFFVIIVLMIHISYFRFWNIEQIGDGFILMIFHTIKDILEYPLNFKI